MSDHETALMRETDRWLRRFAIIGPIAAYMVGTMTGFVGAAWLFRDHEKRLATLEIWHTSHDRNDNEIQDRLSEKISKLKERQDKVLTVIDDKFRIKIP
jgi:hypothetical protein